MCCLEITELVSIKVLDMSVNVQTIISETTVKSWEFVQGLHVKTRPNVFNDQQQNIDVFVQKATPVIIL